MPACRKIMDPKWQAESQEGAATLPTSLLLRLLWLGASLRRPRPILPARVVRLSPVQPAATMAAILPAS